MSVTCVLLCIPKFAGMTVNFDHATEVSPKLIFSH